MCPLPDDLEPPVKMSAQNPVGEDFTQTEAGIRLRSAGMQATARIGGTMLRPIYSLVPHTNGKRYTARTVSAACVEIPRVSFGA
jgi:hypothetical protein